MNEVKPDTTETVELLEKIQDGADGFDELFAEHRQSLREVVNLRFDPQMRARVDPSDVVQETQIEAFRRLPDYLERRPMPFHLWLRKMAYERLIMMRRKHVVAGRRAVSNEMALPNQSSVMLGRQLLADVKSPSQQIASDELARRVQQAISGLEDNDREILLMRTYEGLSYQEIACILEIEPATARKRNGRALIKLHKALTDKGVTESQI